MGTQMTRRQVAEAAGLSSEAAVRAIEARGELCATRDAQGRMVFAEEEVNAWLTTRGARRQRVSARPAPPRDPGRVAARVFALLDEGEDLRGIVRRCHLDPVEVRRLYAEWQTSLARGAQLEAERDAERARVAERERNARRLQVALGALNRPHVTGK
jgi:hypothetical protein